MLPIVEISVADYENSLRVKLHNRGNGPLLVRNMSVLKNNESKCSVIDWMGSLNYGKLWNHFVRSINGRSIQPGNSLTLLELTMADDEEGFSCNRDQCRLWLKDLQCEIEFTDIYGTEFDIYKKKLNWFGRHLE